MVWLCARRPVGHHRHLQYGQPLRVAIRAITGSEVERWGLGVVQEINSAAMHVFARWQHQELERGRSIDATDDSKSRIQGFDDFDLFQVGGIIFF